MEKSSPDEILDDAFLLAKPERFSQPDAELAAGAAWVSANSAS
jgi:hypothetical protein